MRRQPPRHDIGKYIARCFLFFWDLIKIFFYSVSQNRSDSPQHSSSGSSPVLSHSSSSPAPPSSSPSPQESPKNCSYIYRD